MYFRAYFGAQRGFVCCRGQRRSQRKKKTHSGTSSARRGLTAQESEFKVEFWPEPLEACLFEPATIAMFFGRHLVGVWIGGV